MANIVIINGTPVEFVQLRGRQFAREEDGQVIEYRCITHLYDGRIKVTVVDTLPIEKQLVLAVEAAIKIATGSYPEHTEV